MTKIIDYDCNSCGKGGLEEDEVRGLESGKFYYPVDSESHICQKCLNNLAMMEWIGVHSEGE